jgi:hypothetical protein
MEQQYKSFFVTGEARMVHQFSPDWYPYAAVYKAGRGTSIVQVARFELPNFTMDMKELAEWFGLELAMMVVDYGLIEQ